MPKALTAKEKEWYLEAIDGLGGAAVVTDRPNNTVTYNSQITSDESHVKSADPEELAHAVMIGLLHSNTYKYPLVALCHEMHFEHGSKGSKSDEVDILVRDEDQLPYAIVELKAASEFKSEKDDAIKNQLFGTAPLVGSPKLLVYATVEPKGSVPKIRAICIDYTKSIKRTRRGKMKANHIRRSFRRIIRRKRRISLIRPGFCWRLTLDPPRRWRLHRRANPLMRATS